MKNYLSWPYMLWHFTLLIERTGKAALSLALLPVMLFGYWLFYSSAQIEQLKEQNATLEQELKKPIPALVNNRVSLHKALDDAEYQQVKLLFDLLQQQHLRVKSSQYQFGNNDKTQKRTLTLTIPLYGEWLNLARVLQMLSNHFRFQVNRLVMTRPTPDSQYVQMNLQLTLILSAERELQ